jgi:hypothetical protein
MRRNAAQVTANAYDRKVKKKCHVWSRGVGKTDGSADHMDNVVHDLPRSVNNFIVPSYKKFLKEMIPSLKKGLERLGYFQDLHYWVGEKPNRKLNIPSAYMNPTDYTNIIKWYNGSLYQIVSQDVEGSGRALSVDTELLDEALLLDKAKYDETSSATMRGSKVDAFIGKALFGSSTILTSMPILQSSKWILDYKNLALEFPKDYFFSKFDVSVNLANLRPGYVKDALQTALFKWKFDAEYLNIEPNMVVNAFYPLLKETHHGYIPEKRDYNKYEDCRYDYGADNLRGGDALILGVDYGSRINYMCVNQLREEGTEGWVLRSLNEFWALKEEGEIQSDMVTKFHEYYSVFPTKRIILFCDRQGNNDTGITNETRTEMLIAQLTKLGWSVDLMSYGKTNPLHEFTRTLWESVHKENDKRLIKHRINLLSCRNLFISMQNAETKTTIRGRITKNKKSEKPNSNIHPTQATDPSEAMDRVIFGLCGQDFRYNNYVPPLISFSHF